MTKAIIFDMDGTILNTLDDLTESVNIALEKFGFAKHTQNEVKSFVGNGVKLLFERALPPNTEECTKQKCIEHFKKTYSKNMYNHTKPYNGVLEVMKDLRNNGYKIGVVSNKFDKAVKKLGQRYFKGLIDISIGQADDVPQKPAPNGVLKAMRELGVQSAILVGDSDVDIRTAKNAGIPSIGVTWGFRSKNDLCNANAIAETPLELLEQIKNL